MLSRRAFMITSGTGFVTLILTPLLPGCGSDDDGTTTSTNPTVPTCDGAGATSTVAVGHSHTICVPASDLDGPPPLGMTNSTSNTDGHDHTVFLTRTQLGELNQDQTVTVTTAPARTSTIDLHTHDFSVSKATELTPPVTSPGY